MNKVEQNKVEQCLFSTFEKHLHNDWWTNKYNLSLKGGIIVHEIIFISSLIAVSAFW